jgi:small-conductance mechanosensitive channel
MTDWFTAQRFAELGDAIYQWLLINVFVLGNAVQLLVIGTGFVIALFASRRLIPWVEAFIAQRGLARFATVIVPLVLPLIWLVTQLLAIVSASALGWPNHLLVIVASLLSAWVAIRLVSQLVRDPVWSKVIAWTVWFLAALNIVNLLQPTIALLNSVGVSIGDTRLSLYSVVKSLLIFAVLLWLAIYVTGLLETKLRTSRALSPSLQVLFGKSLKATLVGLAVIIAVTSVGIDLTALAVLGGALGLGIGFGLQRVVSNMVSGVVLLLDQSIRPGDVISVSGTYGWVTALAGRYVSVVTRDGVEHMIPNETLISERVENWTHTNSHTRLKIGVHVHYDTDVHRAIDLCQEAARETERVLEQPEPKCLLIAFGENALELEVRIWIADAHNGVQNVKSAVLLRIWEKFCANGIKVPYPQRELHVMSPSVLPAVRPARG